MATMKDVAELAGVSTATVSRALMNPEKVSSATRQKVEDAVIQSGYCTSNLLRGMKRNESKTLVVIVPDLSDPYFSEILRGIEHAASKQGYLVLHGDSQQQKCRDNSLIHLNYSKQADGLILLGTDLPIDARKSEQKNLPPMVMACEYAPELELPTIHIDNLTASYEAVNYLAHLGHRHIAEITGPPTSTLSSLRSQGFRQALRRAGLPYDSSKSIQADFSFEAGVVAMRKLSSSPSRPTAVFCHNDIIAIGVIHEAKNMGLRVPEDLSIIGFDNISFSEYCDPPLTTVAQPRFEIGYQAAQVLLNQLRGDKVHIGSRLLDTELILRKSTKPPCR
ncbi:DNA-binding transcriptional regulator CytR [Vibrio gallicus]|uniref:DNA-binding transcriptional regulator CytR n=1 Tax=Vibrio gallicus TaxID=190897 RepID=UPI0021C45B1C|nr:DNA-binding transcriptional regulator CytR [Vibrio gallicus]